MFIFVNYFIQECGKCFIRERNLEKHKKSHESKGRGKLGDNSSGDDIPDAGEVEKNTDDEDYPSPGRSKRKRRASKSKKTVKSPERSERGTNSCSFCTKSFKTNIELRRHFVNSHRNQYLKSGKVHCVVCFHLFGTQQELEDHCNERHSKFKCKICKKQLQSSNILKQHMNSRHRADNAFICSLCNNGFATDSGLKKHLRLTHERFENGENSEETSNSAFSPVTYSCEMMDF